MNFDTSTFNSSFIISLFSGAFLWEALKFFYPEIRDCIEKKKEAKKILFQNMDLAIKSADEVFGKLESLAREDFSTFINKNNSTSESPEHNQIYVCYLIAQFWAALENIRIQSSYTSISRLKKGKELIRFIETIESRKFRLLDRSKQRIIGEGLIINSGGKFKIMPLYLFFYKLQSDITFSGWINELKTKFMSTKNTETRQKILVHGVIIAMFLDHFDNQQNISRRRKIYLNKLRPESIKLIKNTLLNHYLPFVKQHQRYTGF